MWTGPAVEGAFSTSNVTVAAPLFAPFSLTLTKRIQLGHSTSVLPLCRLGYQSELDAIDVRSDRAIAFKLDSEPYEPGLRNKNGGRLTRRLSWGLAHTLASRFPDR
jgi:hypothetical protein